MKCKLKKLMKLISATLLTASIYSENLCSIHAADTAGYIKVNMKYKNEDGSKTNLTDGSLSIYKIADESGNIISSFENCEVSGTDDEKAKTYLEYADENMISPSNTKTITDGAVEFKELENGTYLITQTVQSKGYSLITPFLVTLPASDAKYQGSKVIASPKVEKIETHVLTIEKVVKGNMGSKDKEFNFTIKSAALANTSQELEDGSKLDFNASGEATFKLCGGETIKFVSVSDGADITVTEDDYSKEGYITTYDNNQISSLSQDESVVITNTRTTALPTGNTMQMTVQLIGFGILIGICATKIICRTKKSR